VPFRLADQGFEYRAKVQFTTSAQMPMMVYEACLKTGCPSNTVYYQHATCAALARDLGLDYDELIAALPPPRGPAAHLYDPTGANHTMSRFWKNPAIGPANTIEEVR
jgi:hypothetical protein